MSMDLKHAILGLLSLQPMSGYDLGRAFEHSVAHFWYADRSQIYRTLARLGEEGAIDTTVHAQDGKPDRNEHTLTDAGRAALHDWLVSPLSEERAKEPFLARLFFAAALSPDEVRELLVRREAQVEEFTATLAGIDAPADDLAGALRAATLRNGLAHAETELAWLRATRRRVDEFAPSASAEQSAHPDPTDDTTPTDRTARTASSDPTGAAR